MHVLLVFIENPQGSIISIFKEQNLVTTLCKEITILNYFEKESYSVNVALEKDQSKEVFLWLLFYVS